MSEFDLVVKLRDARLKRDELEESLKTAKSEYDSLEQALIEAMTANGQEATARYEGLGYVRMMKPRLFASFRKENEDQVFKFLEDSGRADLIKPTVHAGSLSSYVSELVEAGSKIPETINYYLKPSLRLFA
jgi:hypothetical protein